MIMKKAVWFIVLSSSTVILGITNFTSDKETVLKGSDVVCTCVTQNNIEWQLNDGLLSACSKASGACSPKPAGYAFQNDVSNADKEYTITVQTFDYNSCGVYSCTDTTTSAEEKVSLTIADFDSSAPSKISEPGSNNNGTIEITTNCLFKESDIVVKWSTVSKTNGTEDYEPKTNYSVPTNCTDATKTCNGERAVTLNIGFEHTEKSVGCVKFKLEVYHSANPSDKIELVTTGEYCIKDSTTNSTPLPTGAANATDANNAATTMLQTTTQNNITSADSSQKKIIIIACVVAGIVLLSIVFAFCYYFHYKRQEQKKKEKNKFSAEMHTHEHTGETV